MKLLTPLLLGCVCFSSRLPASPITFAFSGSVTEVNFDPSNPFPDAVAFGSQVAGSFTFESTSVDLISGPEQGSYQVSVLPFGVVVTVPGHTFILPDFLAINTLHSSSIAQFGVLACSGGSACNGDLRFDLLLSGQSSGLTSDALPVTPPDLAIFPQATFSLTGLYSGSQIEIDGNIASLSLAQSPLPAPEPGTLALCSAGLLWSLRRLARNSGGRPC